ncbi:MAG: nitrous oxide reductase accessory protein NosL [Phycisphaerales bacterium]|nr:nitrous oxide reductase accessory protein NosL [Phycisphaerales bacterium]
MSAKRAACLGTLALVLGACSGPKPDEPPHVNLDADVCAECGMILSDERSVTATIIAGERGHSALLFDDFNCQIQYETAHPEGAIIRRWAHDYNTRAWLDSASAHFVRAKELYTPMMSHIVAFARAQDAAALADQTSGTVSDFSGMQDALRTE